MTRKNGVKKYPGQSIPTLEQSLEICEKYSAKPIIEIKGGSDENISQLTQLISDYDYKDFIFISFEDKNIRRIKSLLPDATILWLINKPTENDITYCLEHIINCFYFDRTCTFPLYFLPELYIIEKDLCKNKRT